MKKIFKISAISVMSAVALGAVGVALGGCTPQGSTEEFDAVTSLTNGGFESSDLSGWTVEYGNAFDDDSVSSVSEFYFPYDADRKMIPVNHTGNWYLSGKGYDGKRPHGYTGSIRSQIFTLGGDGSISMKIAGGALVTSKAEGAPKKSPEKICYVGVYTASDDKMVAKFTNKYFLEHTEPYVTVSDYTSGTCNTDNFYRYTENLSEYYGREMYIRIIDNDTDVYYGYISVDDICIGGEDAQTMGALYVKTPDYSQEAVAPSKYEIANGDFELGSIAGWTVISGNAFSNDGVNKASCWWNESIPYDRDGEYHYGFYEPTATGVMRSSEFVLGGSGYISYKLGGCSNNQLTYLRFMVKTDDGVVEAARFSNYKYWNYQFPFVQNGMRLLNLVQYYADFSEYLGKTMYIEAVDENASAEELGCMTLDSVKTYYEVKPVWYDSIAFEARPDPDLYDIEPISPHQVYNGTFEKGDLSGWTMVGDLGKLSDASGWWAENYPYNKKGKWLFTGIDNEIGSGTLTSSEFTLGGTGDMTFRLGGGGNPAKCYVSVIDAETEEELLRVANLGFRDNGTAGINSNSYLANMVLYHANLIDMGLEAGRKLKLRITDNANTPGGWGLITADSFITYYESTPKLDKRTVEARNIRPAPVEQNEYNIVNGDFELGNMTGWTAVGGANIDGVATGDTYWGENIPYNNGGLFHFDGWKATNNEADSYAIRSTEFVLGGSGFISFKMAGRSAAVKIYKKGESEPIAVFRNTAFSDKDFPHVDKGCRLATMTTFYADLHELKGETLIVELCDEPSELNADGEPLNWGFAFFDDIVTYYETAPSEDNFDTVTLNAQTSATGVTTYNIPWVEAVNALGGKAQ